eukprot:comp23292_c0_seq1/m.38218 comp23292_c0_seq1/g.38218  ORF comp23292_c0_seq1/g.38218 comp23292_c0_seq1/m.38218 type:complete len:624 (-) comp23292_c0_seq1:231-2102(-)
MGRLSKTVLVALLSAVSVSQLALAQDTAAQANTVTDSSSVAPASDSAVPTSSESAAVADPSSVSATETPSSTDAASSVSETTASDSETGTPSSQAAAESPASQAAAETSASDASSSNDGSQTATSPSGESTVAQATGDGSASASSVAVPTDAGSVSAPAVSAPETNTGAVFETFANVVDTSSQAPAPSQFPTGTSSDPLVGEGVMGFYGPNGEEILRPEPKAEVKVDPEGDPLNPGQNPDTVVPTPSSASAAISSISASAGLAATGMANTPLKANAPLYGVPAKGIAQLYENDNMAVDMYTWGRVTSGDTKINWGDAPAYVQQKRQQFLDYQRDGKDFNAGWPDPLTTWNGLEESGPFFPPDYPFLWANVGEVDELAISNRPTIKDKKGGKSYPNCRVWYQKESHRLKNPACPGRFELKPKALHDRCRYNCDFMRCCAPSYQYKRIQQCKTGRCLVKDGNTILLKECDSVRTLWLKLYSNTHFMKTDRGECVSPRRNSQANATEDQVKKMYNLTEIWLGECKFHYMKQWRWLNGDQVQNYPFQTHRANGTVYPSTRWANNYCWTADKGKVVMAPCNSKDPNQCFRWLPDPWAPIPAKIKRKMDDREGPLPVPTQVYVHSHYHN